MAKVSLGVFKQQLKRKGFKQKAIVSDAEMTEAKKLFDAQKGVLTTPDVELRYIEGLFALPFGYIESFKILPEKSSARCACGRTPSALDLVYTAFRKRLHERELMRDTLIGFANVVELAENGRAAECVNCGRELRSAGYYTRNYRYA